MSGWIPRSPHPHRPRPRAGCVAAFWSPAAREPLCRPRIAPSARRSRWNAGGAARAAARLPVPPWRRHPPRTPRGAPKRLSARSPPRQLRPPAKPVLVRGRHAGAGAGLASTPPDRPPQPRPASQAGPSCRPWRRPRAWSLRRRVIPARRVASLPRGRAPIEIAFCEWSTPSPLGRRGRHRPRSARQRRRRAWSCSSSADELWPNAARGQAARPSRWVRSMIRSTTRRPPGCRPHRRARNPRIPPTHSPAADDPSRRGDAVCARARPGRSRQMSRGSTARRWRPPWG